MNIERIALATIAAGAVLYATSHTIAKAQPAATSGPYSIQVLPILDAHGATVAWILNVATGKATVCNYKVNPSAGEDVNIAYCAPAKGAP